MPLLKLGAVALDKCILMLGGGVKLFGTSIGGDIFRGGVNTFGAEGAIAEFQTEDYAATVRTSPNKAGAQLIVGQSLVAGGTWWAFKKIKMANRIEALLPLMDYLQAQIGRMTGADTITTTKVELPPRPLTIEDFAENSPLNKGKSASTIAILEQASKELSVATDPAEIQRLRRIIQQTAVEIQSTARKIGTVSDMVQFLNSVEYNPVLAQSIATSGVPDDVLKLVPDLVELIDDGKATATIPKGVLRGLEQMFGSTIVPYGNDVANAAKGVATGAFNAVNAVTQLKPSDFVAGELTNVDEVLKNPPKLTATEVAVVSEQAKDISKSVKQYEKGVKTVKNSIKVAKAGSYLSLIGLIDLGIFLGTAVLDLVLNWFNIPEEKQRIPILADIPYIGGLFDLSESVGTSPFDVFIFNPIIDWLIPEDPYAKLVDVINGDYDTFDLFVLSVLTFWVDEIEISPLTTLPIIAGDTDPLVLDSLPFPLPKVDPIDILAWFAIACVAKIVVKGWVLPAWRGLVASATQYG